ncbi:phosphatase PAP2 family protein [Streptomyces griseocarneus]|uniref:phosphatase PAP2 family protein n=1 Tax=Streptomyces griseocarneus TaxID=51201 RepID=UPI00167D27D2|nr:phosphatase PAP2 family protein [Streptomyces griseocarneus]MBZ6475950.1 phosphatase PAP2 family protein [Streptomyces griseocarneus]GHG49863.1 phosphatase PAP2 family protein [Streptomyces griseocarneus]
MKDIPQAFGLLLRPAPWPAFDGSGIDGGLYTDITRDARRAPWLLNDTVVTWSAFGLGLFAALVLAAWWRARRSDSPMMARVLATPLVLAVVYGVDLALKALVREERPCRSIPGSFTLESCPASGDWSFPSNHAVIAFAAAAALWLVDRRLGALAVPAAVAMAASRVWIGVHYPHDVALGALVGIALAAPLTVFATRGAPWVERARKGRLRPLLLTAA